MSDHERLVKGHILEDGTLVRAVFSGRRRGHTCPWIEVVIRPVRIGNKRQLQFSYFDGKKDVTKNYTDQAEAVLDELLALPFTSIQVNTADSAVQVQITRKGKAIVHRHGPVQHRTPSLQHDRHKKLMLPVDRPDPFLRAIGIMTQEGKVRARARKKFQQINEFLKLVVETGEWSEGDRPLRIIDCGCGKAYLTFAVYHYFNHILGVPIKVLGVDVNRELLDKQAEQGRALGWDGLSFQVSSILDFQPTEPPDVVLALHACDTATDEALAQAIRWQSDRIYTVPCCHHHLQQQMRQGTAPVQLRPILRHGALRERLGDILTDGLRAQILRIMGYRTDVIEFVSTEHTAKNLMIRAVKSAPRGDRQAIHEYEALTEFCQVRPYLAQLLDHELARFAP